jgi:succinate dehydrogenase / fumarate reductase flavoprotein subunit
MWDKVGMARDSARLKEAIEQIPGIRNEFWQNVNVTGESADLNVALEKALRVADFLEFAEVMAWDALERDESCGAHFRIEHQYPDGEAKRDDEKFAHVAAWEYTGDGNKPVRHVETLEFENVHLAVRSYK